MKITTFENSLNIVYEQITDRPKIGQVKGKSNVPENLANNAPTFAVHPFLRVRAFLCKLHNLIMIIQH